MISASPALRDIRPLAVGLLLCTFGACEPQRDTLEPVPDPLRGAYGRSDDDAFLPTLGLEVDVDTLRYSELTVKIVAGHVTPNGAYQIDLAEIRWAKNAGNKEPKKCKGTLDRHGSRLLLTMFEGQSDAPCESSLTGDWEAWSLVDAVPPSMAGSYGRKDPYAAAEGLRLENKSVHVTGTNRRMTLDEALMFDGKPNHLVVRNGAFGTTRCRGSIDLVEERLVGKLDPIEDTGPFCPSVFGYRWSIDTAATPKGRLSNGTVRAEIRGETVLLETLDEQRLRCEQAILRTANRNVADSGRDGIPVMGGQVLVLSGAKPAAGASACADRLAGLALAQCEAYLGVPCTESMLSAVSQSADDVRCPTHLIVGEPEGGGKRKVALLPQSLESAVCWELRAPMVAAE